jgi:diguanylate cyclase (GGDEF)-like protein
MVLADSVHGSAVDRLLAGGIPTIVFTGIRDEGARREMLSKRIVDYVYKDVPEAVDEVVTLVRRVLRNPGIRVLVVEDSLAQREELSSLLRRQNLTVVDTPDPTEALAVLENDDGSLELAIVDYFMPGMDGVQLTRALRGLRPRGQLAVIGLSVASDESLPVQFLKAGADDFLVKPFSVEALNARVSLHLDMVETVAALHRQSTCDYLTGLANRRLFFAEAPTLVHSARKAREKVAVGMIDIDDFKAVNDRHGHQGGDGVLRSIAAILRATDPPPALAARFGGEEFCVLLTGEGDTFGYFDRIRRAVEADGVEAGDSRIACTVSIGIATASGLDVDGLISAADRLLYQAKRKGKNRVEAQ